jgi:hypothetical protein
LDGIAVRQSKAAVHNDLRSARKIESRRLAFPGIMNNMELGPALVYEENT